MVHAPDRSAESVLFCNDLYSTEADVSRAASIGDALWCTDKKNLPNVHVSYESRMWSSINKSFLLCLMLMKYRGAVLSVTPILAFFCVVASSQIFPHSKFTAKLAFFIHSTNYGITNRSEKLCFNNS